MNKRQKKKMCQNNLIKIKKLHPKSDDIICIRPNTKEVSIEGMIDFLSVLKEEKAFKDLTIAIIPSKVTVEERRFLIKELCKTTKRKGK